VPRPLPYPEWNPVVEMQTLRHNERFDVCAFGPVGRLQMSCRKQLAGLVALIILLGGSLMVEAAEVPGSNPQTYISNSQFVSKRTAHDFVPDGNLAKPAWHDAAWAKVNRDAFKP